MLNCIFCHNPVRIGYLVGGGAVCQACADRRKSIGWSNFCPYEFTEIPPGYGADGKLLDAPPMLGAGRRQVD